MMAYVRVLIGAMAMPIWAQQDPSQRLPRQEVDATAALQGIVRNPFGIALGDVAIILRNASKSYQTRTSGDGIFRFVGLAPGRYELTASLDRFASFTKLDIDLTPGTLSGLEVKLEPLEAALEYRRELPFSSDLGTRPEPVAPDPAPSDPYRNIVQPQMTIAALPVGAVAEERTIFTPVANRWSETYPLYRRYSWDGEFPYAKDHLFNPFKRNKLKGDYPIFGNQTFLNITLTSSTLLDGRRIPTPSNVAAEEPGSQNFFGRFGQFFNSDNLSFSFDLFHGDAAFRPIDWRIRVTPDVNVNYLLVQERGIVNIDPREGTTRVDAHIGLQEAFVEVKLKDLSHDFDFVSGRAGIQEFNSDFRGFIFLDQEPGLRIFGNLRSNRYQYNLAYFSMLEKDTNSGVNRLEYRGQQVFIANLYRQDFIKPGYTIQVSFHYDKDDPSFRFDENHFLVRPAPVGSVKPHAIRAYYYGLTGDGHLGRLNLTHAFYQVLGHDTLNPIAGRRVGLNAQMAAVELSLDKDWLRYRTSFFYASGDKNPRDGTGRGFDAIFDSPNFAGGIFSFWNREGIRLTGSGVALVSPDSLLPSLRSSKIEGQANFVNPGLFLYNAGVDADLTTKLRVFVNCNVVRFDRTAPLELLLFQKPIHAGLGVDYGLGARYRPPLTDNIVLTAGVNAFQPSQGFRDIYTNQTLLSAFVNVRFQF